MILGQCAVSGRMLYRSSRTYCKDSHEFPTAIQLLIFIQDFYRLKDKMVMVADSIYVRTNLFIQILSYRRFII